MDIDQQGVTPFQGGAHSSFINEHRDLNLAGSLAAGSLELSVALSGAESRFASGDNPARVTDDLAARLLELRNRYAAEIWNQMIPLAQRHPLTEFYRQDPFTDHSFKRPRGYPGDAQLLDFIYGHRSIAGAIADASPQGRTLYAHSSQTDPAKAVVERRNLLAAEVDRTASNASGKIDVLAIAAGHLREAELSQALQNGLVERWVALDQDPVSLGAILRDANSPAIIPFDGSVKGILSRSYDLGLFDLVYAAGLYDYLNRAVSIKLTRRAMQMLKPGGSYLFANFSNELRYAGYMETFMDWPLLLRTEDDMWDIAKTSVDRNKVDIDVFYGENRNVIYTRLTKKD